MQNLLHQTLANIVTMNPAAAPIFEQFGLDYCCGGKVSLEAGCKNKDINPDMVTAILAKSTDNATCSKQINLANLSIPELVEHIFNTHHVYLKETMPHITLLLEKVVKAHGANHPELMEVKNVYATFRFDMEQHLAKEEQILFPMLREITNDNDLEAISGFIECPIHVMHMEHDQAGNLLAKLRSLTNDFQVSPDGCNSYKILYAELLKLEQDTHQHVHKENNILFPKTGIINE